MPDKLSATNPQETAIKILAWLANEPDMLSRFLALSGLQADQIRTAATDPGFLAGLLDFMMAHEPSLMSFCEETDTKPETVAAAWHQLSGPLM